MWLLLSLFAGAAPPTVPILPKGFESEVKWGPVRCNYAKVIGARRLVVRAGPSRAHAVVGSLAKGAIVYTCNSWFDGRRHWDGIAFGLPGRACGDRTTQGLDVRLVAKCTTGWAVSGDIEILSG